MKLTNSINQLLLFFLLLLGLGSCKYYRQDIILRESPELMFKQAKEAEDRFIKAHELAPFDQFSFTIYLNEGEEIVDPTGLLEPKAKDLEQLQQGMGQFGQGVTGSAGYRLDEYGNAKLPMIGKINLLGFTQNELDSILAMEYSQFYDSTIYVESQLLQNFVYIISPRGGLGGGMGGGQMGMMGRVNLFKENTNVLEVIAMIGGIPQFAKADEIRLFRGDASNFEVYVLDLSNTVSIQNSLMNVKPYDIIYIEPGRRPFFEGLEDFQIIASVGVSIFSTILILLVTNTN